MNRRMKDSGVEWIGEIPEDWEISRLKSIGETRSGLGNKKQEDFGQGYPFISYKNIYDNFAIDGNYPDRVLSSESERTIFSVQRGDAFFTGSSETIEELGLSSVCLKDIVDATFNGFCIRFRPNSFKKYYPEYYMYYFRSSATREHLIRNDNSVTRANLSQRLLGTLPVLLPAYDEQVKISNHLDKKTATIDHIIEKTKESIEDYKLYKQSRISEVVTKGLNPDVKLKDSRVEWIGEIPEHWGIQKLKHIGDTKSGLGNKTPQDFGHGYPFVSYKNVYDNFFISDKYPDKVQSTENERILFNVLRGDAFFTGSSETVEELGMSSMCLQDIPNATFNGFCIRLRPYGFAVYHPEFYMYYFRSNATREHLVRNDNSVTRANLSQRLLRMLSVVIPPLNEQVEIAQYLDRGCRKLDKIIIQKKQLIEDLEAYKKSLIYEVVTGKREVQ